MTVLFVSSSTEVLSLLTSGRVSVPAFVCSPLSLSASLWGRTEEGGWGREGEGEGGGGGGREGEEGEGRGRGVMGGGLLPSICCDGRLGSPEGASAWPDRNHH